MEREVINPNQKQIGISRTFPNRHLNDIGDRNVKENYNRHSREIKHCV